MTQIHVLLWRFVLQTVTVGLRDGPSGHGYEKKQNDISFEAFCRESHHLTHCWQMSNGAQDPALGRHSAPGASL